MVVITQQVPLRAAMGAPRPAVCMLDDGERSFGKTRNALKKGEFNMTCSPVTRYDACE